MRAQLSRWFNAQVGRSGAGNDVFVVENKYIAFLSVFSDGEF